MLFSTKVPQKNNTACINNVTNDNRPEICMYSLVFTVNRFPITL